jgi:hypothetical protein
MKAYGGVDVYIHIFVTETLSGIFAWRIFEIYILDQWKKMGQY